MENSNEELNNDYDAIEKEKKNLAVILERHKKEISEHNMKVKKMQTEFTGKHSKKQTLKNLAK